MARIEHAEWRIEYGDGRAEKVEATLEEGLATLRFETREALTLTLLGTEGQRALEVVRSVLWKIAENVQGVVQLSPEDPGILARTLRGRPVIADCGFAYRNGIVHMLEKEDGAPLPTCACETNTCMLSELSAAPQLFTKNAGNAKARLFDHCAPMREKRVASALEYLFTGENVREWRTFAGKELPGGGTARGIVLQSVEAAHAPWNAYAEPARFMRGSNGEPAPAEHAVESAVTAATSSKSTADGEMAGWGFEKRVRAPGSGSTDALHEPSEPPRQSPARPASIPQRPRAEERQPTPRSAPSERRLPEPPPPKPLRTEYRVSTAPPAAPAKKLPVTAGRESAPRRVSKQERLEADNAAQITEQYDLLCAPLYDAIPEHDNAYDHMLATMNIAKKIQEVLKASLYAARGTGNAEFLGTTLSLPELHLLLGPANERVDACREKLAMLIRQEPSATRPSSA